MHVTDVATPQKTFSVTMKNCSFICSILVLLIHSYNVTVYNISDTSPLYWVQEIISQCIARGAVPFFFISSAFFLYQKEKDILSVYKSRFKSLLLPYLIWNILYIFKFVIFYNLSSNQKGLGLSLADILEGVFLYKYNYAYWFMFYLIMFTLLYPVLKLIICKNKWVCFLGISILTVVYLFNICSHRAIECLIYYYLGAMIGFRYKEKAEKFVTIKTRYKLLTLASFVLIVFVLFALRNIYSNVSLIRNILMVLSLVLIASLPKLKIPMFFLALNFMIYSMHPMILETLETAVYLILPHNDLWAAIDYVMAPAVSFVIIVGVCALLKKILPSFYVILNGNRK